MAVRMLVILLFAVGCYGQTTLPDLDSSRHPSVVVSVEIKDGKIEVVRRSDFVPDFIPAIICIPSSCDYTEHHVWKEIYSVKDGRIVLEQRVEGKIVAAQAEQIEWPKSNSPNTKIITIHAPTTNVKSYQVTLPLITSSSGTGFVTSGNNDTGLVTGAGTKATQGWPKSHKHRRCP